MSKTEKDKVVVTGMGVLSPIGNDVTLFGEGLMEGCSGANPISLFDARGFKTQFACELKQFNPAAHLSPKEVRIYDRFTHIGLITAGEALKHAKFQVSEENAERVGVIWASGNGGFQSFEEGVTSFVENDRQPRFNPYFIPKLLVNMAGGVIALKYGCKGITYTPVSACASSNTAIIEAYNHIKWGHADVIIAGGSDSAITPAGIGGFNAIRALSVQNEALETASKPFDISRDGFVMGEGGGALILESLEHAKAREANILAVVGGGGMTSDAYHLTASHPEGEGAQRAMKMAISEAGVEPEQIDYINAHATSTPSGDLSEAKAISRVFGSHRPKISGTKSMTGHLLGAAAAVEAIASILSIQNQIVWGTINTKKVDPEIEALLDLVIGKSIEAKVQHVISNAFGFGGHNASVLFSRYQA
ncbi:MAG: beta-ketoacyl-ACP synthase II [Cyclobacteriaceae bacterium]